MSKSETCKWIDGPKLRAWLRENGLEHPSYYGDAVVRRLHAWENGEKANVFTADRVLNKCHFHLSEVPEDFYIESECETANKLSPEDKERVREAIRAGAKVKAIALEFEIAPSTVRHYRQAMSHPA